MTQVQFLWICLMLALNLAGVVYIATLITLKHLFD
jgi:hypothetical protein